MRQINIDCYNTGIKNLIIDLVFKKKFTSLNTLYIKTLFKILLYKRLIVNNFNISYKTFLIFEKLDFFMKLIIK